MFRAFIISVIAFVVCAAATYAAVFFGHIALWHVLGVVDRDGGGAMGVAFVIAPAIAVIGGIAGAVAAALYARRRQAGRPVTLDEHRRDVSRFEILTGVLAGGFTGYQLAKFGFWLAGPMQYDAMWKAYAHAWAPMIVTLAGAIVGGLIARRLLR
jgi:hypothetical protein